MLINPGSDTTGSLDQLALLYVADEGKVVSSLINQVPLDREARSEVFQQAKQIVAKVRADQGATSPIDDLLLEYGLSTEEGVILMRLAEALVRTPDFATSRSLIRDKIGGADWSIHAGKSHSFLVNQATNGLRITSAWVGATGGTKAQNLFAKLGDQVMERAVEQAMAIMGDHFVLGRDINKALKRANRAERLGFTHSYDMLGEAAHTMEDADKYYASYLDAINALAKGVKDPKNLAVNPGLSVKLSALHPRYEYAHRHKCVPFLVERLTELSKIAATHGLWLNIDAEEADRLEISLMVFARLLERPELVDWPGLGLVIQAYQRRAMAVIDHVYQLAQSANRKIAVRLVKGAYWDMEIKRAQELGLTSYPVFTRKENTDVSYLACAGKLLSMNDMIFPQFATHNAHTAAAIAHMASTLSANYEFQRLHGMGGALHAQLMKNYDASSRIYAPVGTHKDLLPYLVRRLLENGANSSFVNQLMDERVEIDEIVTDPIETTSAHDQIPNPLIPTPLDILELNRQAAIGVDLTQSNIAEQKQSIARRKNIHIARSIINGEPIGDGAIVSVSAPQDPAHGVGDVRYATATIIDDAVAAAKNSDWATSKTAAERSAVLNKVADLLEQEIDDFLELCVREAGKTLPDAVAEVREAIDFCRYYALQAQKETIVSREPLGIVACISPWNFPLAIFLGQVVACLSVGNTVIAKPAEQTPLIAARAVDLLFRAGVPHSALQLLIGDGAELGNAMTSHGDVGGVCFTGSTRTAKVIAFNLAKTGRAANPFIAETGGLNAMIVDSTALLEQAVQDVVDSAFQSAGQRCSACRIVCVQEEVYDPFVRMLTGAMDELVIGDPANLATDVGPVIDAAALKMIEDYKLEEDASLKVVKSIAVPVEHAAGTFTGPVLLEATSVKAIEREIFGPVLHLVKFKSDEVGQLVRDINGLGYGLTMGLHTRLDSRVEEISNTAHVGNLYVNRNQIGAVVGVHPFGGEGLSGTGPKAGGPHYLFGLTRSSETAGPIVDAYVGNPEGGPIEILLPGPTGESNTLKLFPRDTIICFGGDAPDVLTDQVMLAIKSGASVIAVTDEKSGDLLFELEERVGLECLDASSIKVLGFGAGLTLLNEGGDGVVADGAKRNEIAQVLANRHGAILTVLSMHDPLERFFHERTLTINTTAAGGNASLLALGSEDV